jgi:N-acetylmuramoyl-L-alanine amidase
MLISRSRSAYAMLRRTSSAWIIGAIVALVFAGPSSASGQRRPIIMIDAGHGGQDAGVRSGQFFEKDLVLRIALNIAAEFVEHGYDIRLTRGGDYSVAWPDRRSMAEDAHASLLLMLHANGDEDETLHGAEVYANYEDPASERAATLVADALEAAGSVVVREGRDWPFLKSPIVPTVMIELAYMTHPVERRLLMSDGFHRDLAGALLKANDELLDGVQAISLFGEPLYEIQDTTGVIAEADAALETAPDDVDRIIQAGRVRRNFWQYRQAMRLYSRAIELAPGDWRPYRFRGHRHISLRNFDAAIGDLEAARALAPLSWDVSYHLGLAYFLAGRFPDAADEYVRCLRIADDPATRAAQTEDFRSCSQNADDPESVVAMTEWAVPATLRAGRDAEAEELLESIPLGLSVEENVAYYHDLLFYKGELTAAELLNPREDAPYRRETVGYGVANWLLVHGEPVEATALLEELVQDPWWPGFGRIAAEVELHRLMESR